jgi:hypothetical protein
MRIRFLTAFVAALGLGVGLALSYAADDASPKPAPPAADVWADAQSGLLWQISPTGGMLKWEAAKAHCAGLKFGGHNDWRLPTIAELRSLIRGCPGTEKGGGCGVTDVCRTSGCWKNPCGGCPGKGGPGVGGAYWPPELSGDAAHWFWSSSAGGGNAGGAWGVDFENGSVHNSFLEHLDGAARCVRNN